MERTILGTRKIPPLSGKVRPIKAHRMKRKSTASKNLERRAAVALHGEQIKTPWFEFAVRPDVIVSDFGLVVDAKLRKAHRHHRLYAECKTRYCSDGQQPVIITAEHNDREPLAVIELSFLADLLNEIRAHRARNERT